jgi:protein-S-isoprenylcysteine O-methyltransferase Ste14
MDGRTQDKELTMAYLRQILVSTVIGLIVLGLLLFVPAGTTAYWPGWVFMVVFTVMTQAIGIWLYFKDPALLARRVKAGPTKETRPLQRVLIALLSLALLATAIVSALDWRLGWSNAPVSVIVLGDALVALGLYLTLLVVQQNTFAGSTIEMSKGQTVISTGLYGIVRHPMYLGALIMSAGVPLALGSYWGLLVVAVVLPVLAIRIGDEEQMLRHELAGYAEYAQKVRSRLVPGVW